MDLSVWLAFLVASFLISLSPGPGALSIMSVTAQRGYRAGMWNLLGLIAGLEFMMLVVAVGLGAVLVASTTAFTVLKWLGVAYLFYLGVQAWRAPAGHFSPEAANGNATRWDLVLKGFLVNASNPKGMVFMMAVMPQFLDPNKPLVPQYIIIGLTFGFTDTVVMPIYAVFAKQVVAFAKHPRHMKWVNRSFGGLFMGAAALLATFKRSAAQTA